ncbi:hypothetical protein PN838_11415 [Psychrosphaera sp. G1-22]|uniref:Cyclopropane-fatty-acyl-phospholipid synthase n=1 Tax=Psychrosphaera algicola TaxID=3023714 RepID=A0ABT5FDX2_9GAMM|nr:hypothetical protein [Psychrosphaera sp. G1-22]MDC2889269.1 hypothetical protein [Psychrosphaera sp. G1-22]
MENIRIQSDNEIKHSWFEKRCRQLVFKQFEKLTDAGLTIKEGSNEQYFGDLNSELQSQIIIHDSSTFVDMVKGGSIGAAEAYLDGKWSSNNLVTLIRVFARFQAILDKLENSKSVLSKIADWLMHRSNRNSMFQAKKISWPTMILVTIYTSNF